MKIYPQEHTIEESADIEVKDIPLAYIDTADNQYKVDINIENDFLSDERRQVRPYDMFNDRFTCFFDSNDNVLDDVPLKRKGNRYYYEPEGVTSFTPTRFSCIVNCQRNDKYRSDLHYNIKVWASSEQLSYDLLNIFGNAWKIKLAPQNILVNDGAMNNGPFINQSKDKMMEDDFLFFESPDGVQYKTLDAEGKEVLKDIPINEYLDKHVNVWLSVDKFDEMLSKTSTLPLQAIPIVFKERSYFIHTKKGMPVFSLDTRHYHYDDPTYKYHLYNRSVLLLEKPGKGFVIVTPKLLLDNSEHYRGMLYEVLLKIYCTSYFDIPTPETWITSRPVDYAVDRSDRFSKSQGNINLNRLILDCDQRTDIAYTIKSVTTNKPELVIFSGIDADGEMHFVSLAKNEPVKPAKAVSYYTSNGTIVYYTPEDVYLIERPFKANYSVDSNNIIRISIEPTKSSLHKLHTDRQYELTVPNNFGTYYICANPLPGELSTVFNLVLSTEFDGARDGYKIATVVISCEQRTKIYDVRIMGGGLPEQIPDDYNMMDIGNLNGRPYRLGSTNIIHLPMAYKQFKDRIEDAVNLHAASGEYNIIVFDDRDRKEDD